MNSQHTAPTRNRPPNNLNGRFQSANHLTEYPTMGALAIAAIWPAVFIVALTVADCSPPMSTQVLHAGAVVNMQVAAAKPINTAAVTGSSATLAEKMHNAASR